MQALPFDFFSPTQICSTIQTKGTNTSMTLLNIAYFFNYTKDNRDAIDLKHKFLLKKFVSAKNPA